MTKMNVNQFATNFLAGKYAMGTTQDMVNAGWLDWFCRDCQLVVRLEKLFARLQTVLKVQTKFDPDQTFVSFKNNASFAGPLFDDFRICDIKTGEVLYSFIPKGAKGKAELWGRENGFNAPLVVGSWNDVKRFMKEKAE